MKQHPDLSTLMSYSSGTLSLAFSTLVTSHIETCDHCKEIVQIGNELGASMMENDIGNKDKTEDFNEFLNKLNNKSNSNNENNTFVSDDDSSQSNVENNPKNLPDQSPRVDLGYEESEYLSPRADLAYEESEYMNVSPAHVIQRSDDNPENMTSAQLVWGLSSQLSM